jgi:hypothetical protein
MANASAGAAACINGLANPSCTWIASKPTAKSTDSSMASWTNVAAVMFCLRKLIKRPLPDRDRECMEKLELSLPAFELDDIE